jgi:ligand-binding SRPBCC domain-containing protein
MIYTLQKETVLGCSLETSWEFLRNPKNLNLITPPDLHFQIVTEVPEEMFNGLLIEYSIRIPGIGRQRWLTEIKHLQPYRSFVDEQLYGPFTLWYHFHEITEADKGVRSRDKVTYILPLGQLGRLLHYISIRKTLERIFNYREKQLTKLFPI